MTARKPRDIDPRDLAPAASPSLELAEYFRRTYAIEHWRAFYVFPNDTTAAAVREQLDRDYDGGLISFEQGTGS